MYNKVTLFLLTISLFFTPSHSFAEEFYPQIIQTVYADTDTPTIYEKAKDHENIKMLGHLTDGEKIALIRNCKGLILPSHLRSEAFGIVLLEASMWSKPLVSCEIGTGTSYANLDQVTGYVVESEKPEQLSLAMNKISRDNELCRQLGLNARKRPPRSPCPEQA